MPNDVKIKIRAEGADQAKRDVDQVAQATQQVGPAAKTSGEQAETGFSKIKSSLAGLIGPLGIAGIVTALAGAAMKVANFFDDWKRRCDEAVGKVKEIRVSMNDLFEAMGAVSEKQRSAVTTDTYRLLQETATPENIGIPIINEYTRQYKGLRDSGRMSAADYEAGLKGALGYGTLHGGDATKDLIQMMAGWNMTSAESQGQFRRMIAAGAEKSGLTDAELIGAMSRGMPTIRALGWTPQQAVENVALLAQGEAGMKRTRMPSTTIDALGSPSGTELDKYGIPQDVAQNPAALLQWVSSLRRTMDDQSYYRMLQGVYGREAAAGVLKLTKTPPGSMRGILERAAGPGGAAAEAQEFLDYKDTLEGMEAKSRATQRLDEIKTTEDQAYMKEVRNIGRGAKGRFGRDEPWTQGLKDKLLSDTAADEEAAYELWRESLSEEDIKKMPQRPELYWHYLSPEQKFNALNEAQRRLTQREAAASSKPKAAASISPNEPFGPVADIQQGGMTVNNYNNNFWGDFVNPPGAANVGPRVTWEDVAN